MTDYEAAYISHAMADLQFRRDTEAATQKRHDEAQDYGAKLLALTESNHRESIAARAAETKAQEARAAAEVKLAAAAVATAEAQKYAADKLSAPTFDNLLRAAISRLDDRTSTGKANIVLAVAETLDTHAELMNRLAGSGALPTP
jgi:predicted membrane-bound mannosyltransferase